MERGRLTSLGPLDFRCSSSLSISRGPGEQGDWPSVVPPSHVQPTSQGAPRIQGEHGGKEGALVQGLLVSGLEHVTET